MDSELYDVIIVGSGPAGITCAIDAKKSGLKYKVIEKGCLVNSIYNFPTNLIFFSTADLLEIGGLRFILASDKPGRNDLLKYYRYVVAHYELDVAVYEKVLSVDGVKENFTVVTDKNKYSAKNVVLAIGQYDNPNKMQIPGEHLEKVSHYYTEPHPYFRKKVAIIGGKNTAVESALELYRNGAEVTIIHRGPEFGKSVKYWVLPDIENRLREGKIKAYFNTIVEEIKDESVVIREGGSEPRELANDFVLAVTGYHPDTTFMQKLGIKIESHHTPVHNPETLETNVPGLYVAGVITAGDDGGKVFIENSRNHGLKIIGNILDGSKN